MSWSGISRAARFLAVALIVLVSGAAVGGALTGARAAAEAAPANESVVPPAGGDSPAIQPVEAPQRHSVTGRVVALQGRYLLVRTPDGAVVRVRMRPQTVIRRAGERIGPDTIQAGDRVLVVGRLNERGVLVARGIRVRPGPAPPTLTPSSGSRSSIPAAVGSRSPALPTTAGDLLPSAAE